IVRSREAELGNFYADAFRATAKTDIAAINGGCLREKLPKGDVTRGNLMEITPFGNTLKAIRIKGAVVRAMVEHSVSQVPGNFGGFLDFSGLTFSFDPSKAPGERVQDILVGEEPLDPLKDYTFATVDYLCDGGDDYSMLVGAPVVGEFDTVESVVADYMNSGAEVGADMGRITVLGKEAAADSKEAA
ncbi:MAG: 5'-nucleotidase C-terminal domain-containing protein, partial [Schwartzia sp.]|nr:5'-nucleotidase C-terminal domain-containing protein [Schwartzia sp. (in: firmicutes)]